MTQPPNPYGPPPVHQQQHGVQLDPALAAEMARLQQAVTARSSGRSEHEKRDDEWYETNKPDAVGRTTEGYILALPISLASPGALPFAMTAQHHITVRGKQSSVICPKRDAQIRDPEGRNGPPPECPICDAAEFCFKEMYRFEKGTAEGEMWKQRGKDLNPRDRCFMNVFDLDNVQGHWKVNAETGTAGAVPKIWGFGPEVMKKLMAIAGEVGPFWHPSAFTRLKILCTRTGTEQRNIKYDVTLTMPIAGVQIPQGYEGALQQLIDIDYYRRVRPLAEMAAFVPGYARVGGEGGGSMAAPPAIPNPYAPPPPNPYAPPQQQYAPPPAQYAPPQQQYAPPPAQYAPPPQAAQYAPPVTPPPAPPPAQYAPPPQAAQYAPPVTPPPAPPPAQYAPPPQAAQYAPPPPAPAAYAPPAAAYAPPPMPAYAPPPAAAPPPYTPPAAPGYPPPPPAGPAYSPPPAPQYAPPAPSAPPWDQQQAAPPPAAPPVPPMAPPASSPPAPAGMPSLPPLPPLPR
jgi:hypothetical protein